MGEPVLIEAAINGVVRKVHNPNVPRSRAEIGADILAVLDAGASLVHPHESDEATGPTDVDDYEATWAPVLDRHPDTVLYPTISSTGGFEARFGHLFELARRGIPTIGAIDPGSVNLGVLGPDGVPRPTESVYANSYATIATMVDRCVEAALPMTFAIFDATALHTVCAYHRAGRLPAGSWLKFYFAGWGGYAGTGPPGTKPAPFGLPPTAAALDAYLEVMGNCTIPWGVSAMGGDLIGSGIARLALERGGHVHVGLEAYDGARRPTNVELVTEVVALARSLGREPLNHAECRAALASLR
jgi:3-keto-5-aminohexanoate cleavage enzyme